VPSDPGPVLRAEVNFVARSIKAEADGLGVGGAVQFVADHYRHGRGDRFEALDAVDAAGTKAGGANKAP
jgi:CobQ-like glutamine amidotransferase family enzyme